MQPNQANDITGNEQNIANAIFLFTSFLKPTPYAFKDTIKANSDGLKWNFEIPNSNVFTLMIMENVNIDENTIGYIYVFLKDGDMLKDNDSYRYKCYKSKKTIDIAKVTHHDFKDYFHIENNNKIR